MHEISIPQWVSERALVRLSAPDVSKTVLIVVDMQVVFVEAGQLLAIPNGADIIPNINRLAAAVREGGGTVLFCRHTVTDSGPGALPAWQLADPRMKRIMYDPFRAGGRECELDPRMDYRPGDLIVDKYRFGAFAPHSSDIYARIRDIEADTVIVVGVATNCCCETTARDASQLGFKTYFITDANAARTDEAHNSALLSLGAVFADLRSTDEMLKLIWQNTNEPLHTTGTHADSGPAG